MMWGPPALNAGEPFPVRFRKQDAHESARPLIDPRNDHFESEKLLHSPKAERLIAGPPSLFVEVTSALFGGSPAFRDQLSRGVPYWRAQLDPASGIDIYGNNGIAVGDIDGDGWDEIYVCQPGGLPNRLFRRDANGAYVEITEAWGVGVLDDTACALFLDLRNTGRQDLVVLTSAGPLLFLNGGDRFNFRTEAFRSKAAPQRTFTGMAAADYDRDGKLDLYLCTYVYFQDENQYRYPSPYHDAQNGPPNFLFRNRLTESGEGYFEDVTAAVGLSENNNRYSFAPAWCDYDGNGWPDLYVANDFGRNNLYRNVNGRFRDIARESGVEDLGPGMSAAWFDYDGDGRPDLYVGNMWTTTGQRVVTDAAFKPVARDKLNEAYRRHTKGNSLYRNSGDARFEDRGAEQNVEMGRWAWSCDGVDFDNDGSPEIFITCGMLTGHREPDLESYFWRRVVAESPSKIEPAEAYERGWNTLNQWIREGYSWNGGERNVFYVRKGARYQDQSAASGLNFAGDSRAFAVTDFDGDGNLDVLVKNRLGPQLRAFRNHSVGGRRSIALDLAGTKSNRDAIGARVEVRHAGGAVTRWVAAGSGYLSQHTKRVFIGIGDSIVAERVRITWPSGEVTELVNLDAGYQYRVVEGKNEVVGRVAFLERSPMPIAQAQGHNAPDLGEAWLIEPLPLPVELPGKGVRIVTLTKADLAQAPVPTVAALAIFRRYLFDYRSRLEVPLSLLLDEQNRVHKVYARIPAAAETERDKRLLIEPDRLKLALPFSGRYYQSPGRNLYRFAAAFLAAGYPESALPYLDELLRHAPNNPRALLAAGQIHLEMNQLEKARGYLDRSLALNPASAEAHNNLGGVAMAQHRYGDAVGHFERAIAIRPNAGFALANAAQAHARLGDVPRAEYYFRRALAADPNDSDTANQLGLLLAKSSRSDEAAKLFQQAIAIRRDHAGAINNLGVLYMQTGKLNDAIAALQYGRKAAPEDETVCMNLARVYIGMGNRDRARSVLEACRATATIENALRELNQ